MRSEMDVVRSEEGGGEKGEAVSASSKRKEEEEGEEDTSRGKMKGRDLVEAAWGEGGTRGEKEETGEAGGVVAEVDCFRCDCAGRMLLVEEAERWKEKASAGTGRAVAAPTPRVHPVRARTAMGREEGNRMKGGEDTEGGEGKGRCVCLPAPLVAEIA